MEHTQILLTLALVDFLAVATPGPNFMLVSQAATTASRTKALFVVGGLLASNMTWCAAVFLGLAVIFAASPVLHSIAQVGGAAYLIYLAIGLWRAPNQHLFVPGDTTSPTENKKGNGFLRGWFVGMSNPKSLVYFSSVFTVFLPASGPASLQAYAVAAVALNTVVWYGSVALLLSLPAVQQTFLRRQAIVNRIAGAMLGAFGVRLLLAKADA